MLVATLSGLDELMGRLKRSTCDILLLDEELSGEETPSIIADARGLPARPEVVVLSHSGDPARGTEMLAEKALAVVHPSASDEELADALQAILNRRRELLLQELIVEGGEQEPRLGNYIARSPAMRDLLSVVRRVTHADSTLLVLGETGVGKEHLSRAIHAEGPRAGGPFIAVSCAALSEGVLESELFGHVAGAFTGAVRARRGYFELAHRGTLFLDEIGELSPRIQVKLLRFLQDRKIQPVGSEEEIEVDIRLIAATNRDLPADRGKGRFRSDLYYRLSVVTLPIPPLRARQEDIAPLVVSYVDRFAYVMQRTITGVRPEAMQLLNQYEWPGNIRELANVVERAVLLCEGEEITSEDLPGEIRRNGLHEARIVVEGAAQEPAARFDEQVLSAPFLEARRAVMDTFERVYVEKVLSRCHGRVSDAARMSGINSRTLYEKMQRLGIRKELFKIPPKSG